MAPEQEHALEKMRALEHTFGDRVAVLRTARRLSRRQLAIRSGLTREQIEGIEQGRNGRDRPRRRPHLGEAVALARALGVQMDVLLTPVGGEG